MVNNCMRKLPTFEAYVGSDGLPITKGENLGKYDIRRLTRKYGNLSSNEITGDGEFARQNNGSVENLFEDETKTIKIYFETNADLEEGLEDALKENFGNIEAFDPKKGEFIPEVIAVWIVKALESGKMPVGYITWEWSSEDEKGYMRETTFYAEWEAEMVTL